MKMSPQDIFDVLSSENAADFMQKQLIRAVLEMPKDVVAGTIPKKTSSKQKVPLVNFKMWTLDFADEAEERYTRTSQAIDGLQQLLNGTPKKGKKPQWKKVMVFDTFVALGESTAIATHHDLQSACEKVLQNYLNQFGTVSEYRDDGKRL